MSEVHVTEKAPSALQSDNAKLYDPDLQINFREYLQVLARRKKVIIATVAIIMVLAFLLVSSLTPRYTAFSLVEINPRQTQVVDFDAVLAGLPANNETIETEIKIIASRKIARRAITRLELSRDPEFNPASCSRLRGGCRIGSCFCRRRSVRSPG